MNQGELSQLIRRLDDLRVSENSGVDWPAHGEPGWLMMKNANLDTAIGDLVTKAETLVSKHDTFMKAFADAETGYLAEAPEPVRTAADALRKQLAEMTGDTVNAARTTAAAAVAKAGHAPLAADAGDAAKAAHMASDHGMAEGTPAEEALDAYQKAHPPVAKSKGDGAMALDKEKLDALDPDVRAYIEGIEGNLTKSADELKTANDAVKKAADEKAAADKAAADLIVDPIQKAMSSMPEEVRKALNERFEKAEKDITEARKVADTERETRVAAEYLSKAHDLPGVPGLKVEELAGLMRKADESFGEDAAKFGSLLKSIDELVKGSRLFKEVGRDGGPGTGDASSRIEAAATQLMEKDSKLTKAAAVAQAAEENPELYAEHAAEMRARR